MNSTTRSTRLMIGKSSIPTGEWHSRKRPSPTSSSTTVVHTNTSRCIRPSDQPSKDSITRSHRSSPKGVLSTALSSRTVRADHGERRIHELEDEVTILKRYRELLKEPHDPKISPEDDPYRHPPDGVRSRVLRSRNRPPSLRALRHTWLLEQISPRCMPHLAAHAGPVTFTSSSRLGSACPSDTTKSRL